MREGEKLVLRVKKRTPSLNTLLRQNAWARLSEKQEMNGAVCVAIASALSPDGSDFAITWIKVCHAIVLAYHSVTTTLVSIEILGPFEDIL